MCDEDILKAMSCMIRDLSKEMDTKLSRLHDELREEMKQEVGALRKELREEMKQEVGALRKEFRRTIKRESAILRKEIKHGDTLILGEVQRVHHILDKHKNDITKHTA